MSSKIQWQANAAIRPYGDASPIYEHLEHLRGQDDLTPELMLADARKSSSPLHPLIEWNEHEAAARYRRRQICVIMNRIVRVHGSQVSRIYMSIKGRPDEPRQYDLVSRVLRNPEVRKPYARRALLELASWEMRFRDFPELRGTLAAMRQALKTVVRPALKNMEEAQAP